MTKEQMVSDEEQAAMAIKLADNVRQMIREEIRAALEDYDFMLSIMGDPLTKVVTRGAYGGIGFAEAVRNVMRAQMAKS